MHCGLHCGLHCGQTLVFAAVERVDVERELVAVERHQGAAVERELVAVERVDVERELVAVDVERHQGASWWACVVGVAVALECHGAGRDGCRDGRGGGCCDAR